MLKAFPFIKENKVLYFPNGWEEFMENDIYNKKDNKDGPLTIVHAGNFYPRFKPYTLFYALSAWRKDEHSKTIPPLTKGDIQVILLGAKDETTKKLVEELGLEEFVIIKPWVAQAEAHKYMCQADMLLGSLGTGKESSTYVPSKIFEYIAAKRPILGFFPEGEAASLIGETGTGIVFTHDDSEPVIKFLYDRMSNKKNESGISYSPNYHTINKYHIKSVTARLNDILSGLIENN